jgi:hypothetical protein
MRETVRNSNINKHSKSSAIKRGKNPEKNRLNL